MHWSYQSNMSVDPRSLELAQHFNAGISGTPAELAVHDMALARAIQQAVEDWFADVEGRAYPPYLAGSAAAQARTGEP
jgi:hypothetical protein